MAGYLCPLCFAEEPSECKCLRTKPAERELAQLRAENAELKRKNGLLVEEVAGWRLAGERYGLLRFIDQQSDGIDDVVETAMAATDAGGALGEVGG